MIHEAGVVLDEGIGVGVEVAEHGVAIPAAKDVDMVGVQLGQEESHGSAGSE